MRHKIQKKLSGFAKPQILANKINKMAREDQRAVRKRQESGIVNQRILKMHTEEMKKIMAQYGWPTISLVGEKASKNAWLLVQHSDNDLAFQKKCLSLMKAIYKKILTNLKPDGLLF